MWIEFLITSLIVVVAPGTGVIYTVGVGLARGTSASIAAAFGCTCGILPHMAAAIAGLATLLHASALAFQTFKWAGILYLLYLAWTILREDGPIRFGAEPNAKALHKVALTGFFINILNPKLSIFFLAFLPQFVPADTGTPVLLMAVLSAVFMAMTFGIFICYGAFAAGLRKHVLDRPSIITWIKRGFSAAFVALGVRLAMETA